VKPRKRFAQHFLEPAWVDKLLKVINPTTIDRVLEVGPGRGALTAPLSRQVDHVLAVEIDRDLAAALSTRQLPNVTVLAADILQLDLAALLPAWISEVGAASGKVRVVGNLPYNISSPLLFQLLEVSRSTALLEDAVVMLQREVADRLVAKPCSGEYGVLAVLTALHADVRQLLALPPGAFRPVPRVHSSVVRLTFRPPQIEVRDLPLFVRMVRSMFTQRRKTLGNALKPFAVQTDVPAGQALAAANIDAMRRPETLQLPEFARLADAFSARTLAHAHPGSIVVAGFTRTLQ